MPNLLGIISTIQIISDFKKHNWASKQIIELILSGMALPHATINLPALVHGIAMWKTGQVKNSRMV